MENMTFLKNLRNKNHWNESALKNLRDKSYKGGIVARFSKKFRLRRALIIFRFPKFSCFYYFLKILAKFSLALIIRFLRGDSYY